MRVELDEHEVMMVGTALRTHAEQQWEYAKSTEDQRFYDGYGQALALCRRIEESVEVDDVPKPRTRKKNPTRRKASGNGRRKQAKAQASQAGQVGDSQSDRDADSS